MKKQFLLLLMCCLSIISAVAAGGNKLVNSNMESQGAWQVSYLNTPENQYPVADWNYTTVTPPNGSGGALHVKGTTTGGNSQIAFFQPVTLSADSVYSFDALFKIIKLQRSWCEVFIGQMPVAGQDYGNSLGTNIANFGTWNMPNANEGTFKLNATSNMYNPATSGEYYFVIKMGATTWDAEKDTVEIVLDNLSLTSSRIAPTAAFKADVRSGFAPLTVKFTDDSKMATSHAWDFGDGSTSADKNPTHVYAAVGKYTVKLKVTNEIGNNEKIETDFINVTPLAILTGGGLLKNGNMEAKGSWTEDFLNTGTGNNPVSTWNASDNSSKPNAGQGGYLLIEGPAAGAGVQYAIYQKVHLSRDSVYVFDAAFRDLSANLKNFWTEVYLGTQPAGNGADYGNSEGKMIAKFDAWNAGSAVAGLNGTFKIHANQNNAYTPETTGDYYFVFKMGTWDGPGFKIAIDELSLTPLRTKPAVSFTATNAVGFPALKTVFVNTTKFANSYKWDFGDGSAISTVENPDHTYTVVGTYTVKLTATNEKGDSVLTKTDFVKVNAKPTLPAGEMLYGGNMENGNFWSTNKCNPADVSTFSWNYTGNTPTGGAGGNLRIQTTGTGFNTAIYQEVTLKAGYTYLFDGFFKDVKGVSDYWCEGFIGATIPADGVDYTPTQGTKIFGMDTWNGLQSLTDVQISKKATVAPFKPTVDGKYYFVLKMGSNASLAREILLDELTLKETLPVKADFYAETVSGTAPLTVQFYDLSTNATSWSWDFGDGGTSTEQDPKHTYTKGGTFTVKLTASNSGSSDVLTSVNLISVLPNALKSVDLSQYTISTSNQIIRIDGVQNQVSLYDIAGRKIQSVKLSGKFTSQVLQAGMYILQVDNSSVKIAVK